MSPTCTELTKLSRPTCTDPSSDLSPLVPISCSSENICENILAAQKIFVEIFLQLRSCLV